jgi:hypothetical protein
MKQQRTLIDAPPSSLMDSTASPKVKTTEGKRVGARSLARNTSQVEGHVGTPKWDYEEWQAINHSHEFAQNQTTSWLVHRWSTFGVKTSHGQTWTHKIHHGSDLGEATTFPLIIYFVPGHETNTQMSFCPGTPKWESRNSQNWDFCNFGGP